MRRFLLALSILPLTLVHASARAQAPMQLARPGSAPASALPVEEEEEYDDESYEDEEEEDTQPALRSAFEEEPEEEVAPEPVQTPADPNRRSPLEISGDPSRATWSTPRNAFTLHGYIRTRAEIFRNFGLGRRSDASSDELRTYPFRYWHPVDRGASVEGGCSGAIDPGVESDCYGGSSSIRTANMRVRLQPTIAVSDDIRVHMLIDAFDNMVLGSTPSSVAAGSYGTSASGLDSMSYTLNPAMYGRNSLQDSIYVRRAWAEVRAREIGQLWFGRMPNHWGLGMLFNDGAGIDGDYSSDVDRVMGVVQVAGFQLAAAWDFANQGVIRYPGTLNGIPYNASSRDDIRQFSLIAARRTDEQTQRRRLENGNFVLNYGLYFQYRQQGLSALQRASADGVMGLPSRYYDPSSTPYTFTRRDAKIATLDFWGQFLWRDLRIEAEAALIVGSIGNTALGLSLEDDKRKIVQFGYALEAEYRLYDRRLGIYFDHGLATGDSSNTGLSVREDLYDSAGRRVSTFSFHPNYRVDLILFRNIMGAVSGVYYFKPGVSYDLRRTSHGQLVGVRADAIYSRASRVDQTYGGNGNLGLELNASLYYRSELGPDFLDGLYVMANYGLLFPLAGLGYRDSDGVGLSQSLAKAQTFRVILGVRF